MQKNVTGLLSHIRAAHKKKSPFMLKSDAKKCHALCKSIPRANLRIAGNYCTPLYRGELLDQ